jgi:DNA-binding CsgD family transcriptional regulator
MGSWSNIRRAIDASLGPGGEPIVGLQIAVGLLPARAALLLGSLAEIRGRLEQTLGVAQAVQAVPTELQVAALAQIAWLAVYQGLPQTAKQFLERCVAASGLEADRGGRWRDCPEIDLGLPAVIEFAWGAELMVAHRDRRAIAVFVRAREKFHRSADRAGEARSEMYESMAAGFFGSADQAITTARRQLERTTAAGAGWARSWAQLALAIALTKHGDAQEALRLSQDALTYLLHVGDQWGTTWAVHVRMWTLARLITDAIGGGNASRGTLVEMATEVAYLGGGVKTQHRRLGVLLENLGPLAAETSRAEQIARDLLGPSTYDQIEARGSELFNDRSRLQRLAAGILPTKTSSSAATTTTSAWQALSVAEQQVALLAAAGWPNSAIAVRRGTSTKTIDAQMSSILQKLMISSRKDIASLIPTDQRSQVSAERSKVPRQSRDKP